MEYTDIQSLVTLSEEEVDSYHKRRKSWNDGINPKIDDNSPEFLRVCF